MINESNIQVLLVETSTDFRNVISTFLKSEGFEVSTADTGEQALEALRESPFDVLVTGMDLGSPAGIDGCAVLKEAVSIYPQIAPIALASDGTVGQAVNAMKSGARDYLPHPFAPADLAASIRQVLARLRSTLESTPVKRESSRQFGNIIGNSGGLKRVFDIVETIARGNSTVLITGATGTGKELIAQAIHSLSDRRDQKIVSINCGAIPENLLESEFFGHVKGAFTGAHQTRIGRFEQAQGGTIFLDEIGNMSAGLQVKLLRVLQEREFERVGGLEKVKVDVRIVAATSANLKEMVSRNEFRSDLYYRLNVIPLEMPPLRERRNDIPLLVKHFIAKFCRISGIETKTVTQEAMKMLMNYNWPGNVRELENAIERAVAMIGVRSTIVPSDLPAETQKAGGNLFVSEIYIPDEGVNFNTEISDLERKLILESLRKTNGNRREAAQLLQLKRTTLIEKLRRFDLADAFETASA